VTLAISLAANAAYAANGPIFILVDPVAGRAYVPQGTVLPQGLQVRAQPFIAYKALRHVRPSFTGKQQVQTPPLVFEYAPAERFEAARKQYEERHGASQGRVQANSVGCVDTYVSGSNSGPRWTYYDGLNLHFCGEQDKTVGNSYAWEFTATGDWTDDDEYIDPYVAINDDNNNYYCFYEQYGYGSPSCTASNTTQWTNVGCTNYVHAYALLYAIEYQDYYVPYYVGFSFQIDSCTTFY
jgi:hypothetical protein